MQPTTNFNQSIQHRLDVEPNMSDVLSLDKSYNKKLTQHVYLQRGNVPAIDSKTLIYDQSRIVSPMNYFGTKFINPKDIVYKHKPAGLFDQNSTVQTGSSFTQPFKRQFPQNL